MIDCLTQKVELNYIIPAIRKEMIKILESKEFTDAEISRRLGITKSAVSQYKHNKRGSKINFSEKINKEIKKSAGMVLKGKKADPEINKIIKMLKESRGICTICKCTETGNFRHAKNSKNFSAECKK
ncbi:MAG: hypothetical protein KKE23_02135 [Nanoarchaeota archaeon]|nr:hypothetical protein [Nanoarchaeota archaeon]